ncbi:DUF6893 family small protein [Prauserella cavernicola]
MKRLLTLLALGGAGALAWRGVGADVKRYLRMRRM